MVNMIDQIKGTLLKNKRYIVDILYSGQSQEANEYFFRLNVDGDRCMLRINKETVRNHNPEFVINQVNDRLQSESWRNVHEIEL
jgi:hypothetical protein